jgi:hypothetical protein
MAKVDEVALLNVGKVKNTVQKELRAKTEAHQIAERLANKKTEIEAERKIISKRRDELIREEDGLIREGGAIEGVARQLKEIQEQDSRHENLLIRLQHELIPQAYSDIEAKQKDLQKAVQREVEKQRKGCEARIVELFRQAIELSRTWNLSCSALFSELQVEPTTDMAVYPAAIFESIFAGEVR